MNRKAAQPKATIFGFVEKVCGESILLRSNEGQLFFFERHDVACQSIWREIAWKAKATQDRVPVVVSFTSGGSGDGAWLPHQGSMQWMARAQAVAIRLPSFRIAQPTVPRAVMRTMQTRPAISYPVFVSPSLSSRSFRGWLGVPR